MKRFTQLMSLLFMAAVTQYSCINDADVVFSDESHTDSNGNLALFFEIPNENHTRSAESSGVTETVRLFTAYSSFEPVSVTPDDSA